MTTTNKLLAIALALGGAACSSNPSQFSDAGADGGTKATLGANASIPQTCQTCLGQSSTNECANKEKICNSDPDCLALNTCVNNCANINQGCVTNCGNSASHDVIDEWNAWAQCTCATCSAQCNATFCSIGTTPADAAPAADTGVACLPDTSACTASSQCCTGVCPTEGTCGCIPIESEPDYCYANTDCCSGFCDTSTGYCE